MPRAAPRRARSAGDPAVVGGSQVPSHDPAVRLPTHAQRRPPEPPRRPVRMIRRRLLLVLPTLLGVAVLVFSFIHLVPGDPVDVMLGEAAEPADATALRHALGLDRPLGAQLLVFLGSVARGDLGESVAFREPVAALVTARLPATLELAAAALLSALAIALPLGTVAALRRGALLDRLVRVASLAGVCLPTLWLGPLLVLAFSLHLGWLPTSGRGGPEPLGP